MTKHLLTVLFIALALNFSICSAQTEAAVLTADAQKAEQLSDGKNKNRQPLSVKFDVRADWESHFEQGVDSAYNSAFTGKFLNIIIDGNINKHFSYHFRHRINKQNLTQDFFEATDFAYLKYKVNNSWEFVAGKSVVGIGGFEYDKAPIDVYFYSIGGSNVPTCYEFGISGKYTTRKGNNSIFLQIANSPFTSKSYRFEGLYAYNLMWYGNFGVFNSIYSVNMIEYEPNKFYNYIALGNQFNFGPVHWYIDYINRCSMQSPFFGDFSLISRLTYSIKDRVDIFAKAGWDFNNSDANDKVVEYGTNRVFYGAGVEFYPMKNSKDVRIHAFWTSSSDNNYKNHTVGVGFRWLLHAYEQ